MIIPVYAYKCHKCDYTFDELHTISDRKIPVEKPCPECGEMEIEQMIQAPIISSSDGNFLSKVPDGFKDRLREIKKISGRTSTIDV